MLNISRYSFTDINADIAFTADAAVPGPNDANWKATDSETFQTSLSGFGEKLVTGIHSKTRVVEGNLVRFHVKHCYDDVTASQRSEKKRKLEDTCERQIASMPE